MSGQKMAPVGAGAGDKEHGVVTTQTPDRDRSTSCGTTVRSWGCSVALLVFGLLEPAVLTPANLASVVDQSSSLVILAVGLAIVMMMRGVDLSVAQVSDAAGLIAAMFLVQNQPLLLVFLVPLAVRRLDRRRQRCAHVLPGRARRSSGRWA